MEWGKGCFIYCISNSGLSFFFFDQLIQLHWFATEDKEKITGIVQNSIKRMWAEREGGGEHEIILSES
jgi:hypothetical protein